jgi:F-type H+-transporting ATPase subunit epsilon
MTSMTLKVLLPFEVFANEVNISRMTVETVMGSVGFLPQRLDCVVALVPGILFYEDTEGQEVFLAVDAGVLVKTGVDVVISVRRAIRGKDLAHLQAAIKQQFLAQDTQEASIRKAMAKLESGFLRKFVSLRDSQS